MAVEVVTACLLATTPRSGSWLLSEALHNTERCGQPEEYFRPDAIANWSRAWGLEPGAPFGAYVAAAIDYSTSDNGVFSAKLHWYQLPWLLERLRDLPDADGSASDAAVIAGHFPAPRWVHLRRLDRARQAISYCRAARTQVWFVLGDEVHRSADGVALGEPDYQQIRWFEEILDEHDARWLDFFARSGIEPLAVVYEEFADRYDETVRAVLDYVGVDLPDDVEIEPPGLQKQADAWSERALDGYLEVRDSLDPDRTGLVWSVAERRFERAAPNGSGAKRDKAKGKHKHKGKGKHRGKQAAKRRVTGFVGFGPEGVAPPPPLPGFDA